MHLVEQELADRKASQRMQRFQIGLVQAMPFVVVAAPTASR
jgi:hypothetical protein